MKGRRQRFGILLVAQNAKRSLKMRIALFDREWSHNGEDTADNLRHNPAVINAYLGGHRGNV